MLIAQIKAALGGDLGRVRRIVKLGVFVNSAPGFTDQPKVANGASDLMVALFGEAGRHARAGASRQPSSTTASTSTAAPSGSAATPTAARA